MIIHAYGTRDIYKIHGVFRRIPLVGAATIMAVLGITGAPLFNGSISKYFIMAGTNWLVSEAMILINLGTIISFIKYSSILFGRPECEPDVTKIDACQQAAILILGALCFIGGIFGEQFIEIMFNVNVSVDAAGYLQKAAMFVVSGIAGYFIFKYYVKKSALLKRIYETDLSFNGMCVSIGAFFALLVITSKLFSIHAVRAFFSALLY
jgi:multicomponent Na+:H+ antiporter subunit D